MSLCRAWEFNVYSSLPPTDTDHPEQPLGGTGSAYWMVLASIAIAIYVFVAISSPRSAGNDADGQSTPRFRFRRTSSTTSCLPHFYLFAPIVYGLEVLTAVSLIRGIFVRPGGVIGALQIINLWLGLYRAPGERPSTYFFLLVLMPIFSLHHYVRSLGIDAIIAARSVDGRTRKTPGPILLDAAT